jgi:hypothetical protein
VGSSMGTTWEWVWGQAAGIAVWCGLPGHWAGLRCLGPGRSQQDAP